MRYVVFDIETRVDKQLVREAFFRGQGLSDEEAFARMRERLKEEGGRDFFPVTCHLPVSIAVGDVGEDLRLVRLESLGGGTYSEAGIVREFWQRLERFDGTLVSFSGRNFDLPVLELQALRHGLSAPRYFNESRRYRGRAADRHYDLHEFLSNGGIYRLRGGLDILGRLAGLRGKSDMDGSVVQGKWEAGRLEEIHRYCRDDVLQTYLLFLRVERMRGRLDAARCEELSEAAKRLADEGAEAACSQS